MNIDEIKDLINSCPDKKKKDSTLLEISGFPHYENVCSNILSFFFGSDNEHGLGTFLLDSLINVGSLRESFGNNAGAPSYSEAYREKNTGKGRIDIVIETDKFVIGIENKIDASIGNDFGDYEAFLKNWSKRKKVKYLGSIFMSLKPPDISVEPFKAVLYSEFFQEVKNKIGAAALKANIKYLIFFLDFMESIQRRCEVEHMDKEILEYLEKNGGKIDKVIAILSDVKNDFIKRNKDLTDRLKAFADRNSLEINSWGGNHKYEMVHVLYFNFPVSSNGIIAIDVTCLPMGWELTVFFRGNDERNSKEWFEKNGIMVKESGRTLGRFQYGEKYRIDEMNKVKEAVEELLAKILKLPA